ncbi:MAG: Spo0E like sporulation regulatory protein [Petroclostridium sp.]|jgi:hypothetical protein|uniref:aspartyl-phosphate phosphatase Spo0E family protein n=1 Tax=Petroclostridium xylanilyticum TaxID=1792311 RepID=UPI000E3E131A|nr:aspartyl-phosphate phosphatase Spo0E family protein [Petroclostridium xylanilyticum]MBZ4647141.1 Spo0E like sporulation regulatory protein [Clostridia bacterium]MDK2810863.1 Spo0E like sporulation regulatory protein [Petroclostridium sp.]
MSSKKEEIKKEIVVMQDQLNKLIENEDPSSEEILELSQRLDELIFKYMKSA